MLKMSAVFSYCRQTKHREMLKMFAVFSYCRQTKSRKSQICLPSTTLCRQTKSRKSRKCLPDLFIVGRQNIGNAEYVCHVHIVLADKIDKKQEMSAMYSFCRRTKPRKSQICLPGTVCVGRQNRGNAENICRIHNLPADRSKKIMKTSASPTFIMINLT